MADSFPVADVGTIPRFPLSPNWATQPQSSLLLAKDLIEFRGTAHTIRSVTDDVPIKFEASFTVFTRAELNTLMNFWTDARGACNRFWVKYPYRSFRLLNPAGSGDGVIRCVSNSFEKQYQGYERIYVEMADGDTLARFVTAAVYNETEERLEISLNTPIDRDITLSNHVIIGRYLLARFDSDALELKLHTDNTSEFSLVFYELVREYGEV